MIHNGIEYGDMQLICEAYFMMKVLLKMSAAEIGEVFAEWYKGPLNSYLIEITRDILGKIDPDTGKPLVDVILDKAGQKGTGKWTSTNALDMGVPAPTVAGHSGVARAVDVGGTGALVLGGRSHLYEGHPVDTVVPELAHGGRIRIGVTPMGVGEVHLFGHGVQHRGEPFVLGSLRVGAPLQLVQLLCVVAQGLPADAIRATSAG
jgi:hypothetical protein